MLSNFDTVCFCLIFVVFHGAARYIYFISFIYLDKCACFQNVSMESAFLDISTLCMHMVL